MIVTDRRDNLALVAVIGLLLSGFALADPAWWSERGVTDGGTEADYAPALLGQLKWMATNAYDEMEENLPRGAGTEIEELVQGFSASGNFKVLNVGQLKEVAEPFYDRLIAEGYTNAYPWTAVTTDDVDYAVANIGQLKAVFSFDIGSDSDDDDLSDWWEVLHFGDTTSQSGTNDYDEDGLANTGEYEWGTCPTNSDCDADSILDGEEVDNRTDPHNDDTSIPTIVIQLPENNTRIEWMP
jgi:hypothetical protein